MGQHSWFLKDREIFNKEIEVDKKLDEHEKGIIYLDDLEKYALEVESNDLYKANQTDYHDLFRTWKRNPDKTYLDEVIYSKKECFKWLEDNKQFVGEVNIERLNKFWEEYPNGVIEFG